MNTDRYPESVHLHSPTYSTFKYMNVNAWPPHLSHCRHIMSALYVRGSRGLMDRALDL